MQAGVITIDGLTVGTIEASLSDGADFTPDVQGYVPSGRAEEGLSGAGPSTPSSGSQHISKHHEHTAREHPQPAAVGRQHGDDSPYSYGGDIGNKNPPTFKPGTGRPFSQGSAETDAAIVRASREAGVDPNTMRGIASIESSMNPSSNANRPTQYKGLYQIGRNEWQRFGQGNIYSAEDNAMATARMFKENSRQFENHFGRKPTDTELYLMHQQGLGFYTRGAMTNIGGNPYPGMRGPQTHESFEAGWGRELARRKAGFAGAHPSDVTQAPMPLVQGFE